MPENGKIEASGNYAGFMPLGFALPAEWDRKYGGEKWPALYRWLRSVTLAGSAGSQALCPPRVTIASCDSAWQVFFSA
ncbi:MAG: hypothetical protein JWN34_3459 [Bryobacterales bacterium]|nr:hypothetical protein [Bryobacterales bacterium]